MNSPSLSYAVEFFADVMDQKGVQDRFANSGGKLLIYSRIYKHLFHLKQIDTGRKHM